MGSPRPMERGAMHLSAFIQASPNHQIKGMWKHPSDETSWGYRTLNWWQDLVRTLERGCFDGIFFADVLGTYDVYGASREAALRGAVQIPGIDPTLLIPALAACTEHLGFAVTFSTSHHAPYHTARLFSTLDHLTGGRVGWNIVTSYLSDAERQGLGQILAHDTRYDRADEYVDVCLKLWEQSWDEGAIVLDAEADTFTDPAKVHEIDHAGEWFTVEGPHMVEPSPQRTPVLYQAGNSARGVEFAANTGEVVFMSVPGNDKGAAVVASLREQAAAAGRDPEHIKALQVARVVVAETDAEARAMRDEWSRLFSVDGYLALFCGWTGIDLGGHPPDTPIDDIEANAIRTQVERWKLEDPDKVWTVGDVARRLSDTAGGLGFVGSPTTVADQLEAFIETTGVDGFNVTTAPVPWGFSQIVDYLVPELQRRGRFRTSYEGTTFRENFFGPGQRHLHTTYPRLR
ncbi:LLM class flavin-dependent oxidoreductase [Candidatus Poriferisodalis sp.]|uniref:LLM class flavin-dependent oxidoreductase n=1 Tax=Candidatus Poriferisodalis sp. TaxID=3101277 RepID=UPI003B024916